MRITTVLLVVCLPATAAAQARYPVSEPPTRGDALTPPSVAGTSLSVLNLHAFDFEPSSSTVMTETGGAGQRYISSTPSWTCFLSGVSLPTGAMIDHIEVEGYDLNANPGYLVGGYLSRKKMGELHDNDYVAESTGNPGEVRFSSQPGTWVVDNSQYSYLFSICLGNTGTTDAGGTLAFRSGRVYYRLQVRPAPGTATFNDVPVGDPLHRFVEAVAAAGITGGCGGGNYCPDAPLTRGQMAVFLSVALGLHWPN